MLADETNDSSLGAGLSTVTVEYLGYLWGLLHQLCEEHV